nr:MAG TPA: major capsid protein [Caudoviricetes sp.]
MAVTIKNTNYDGEVLDRILTKAATGNELVQKGLINLVPNVAKKYSIPRLKTNKMLRKRVEQPEDKDSKGDFIYSEKELVPKDFMAFTTFNPRSFESIWRPFQPTGNLVFRELPPNIQNVLLKALSDQVDFELGYHFVNGIYVDDSEDDEHLFNGILMRVFEDPEVIRVQASADDTMIERLMRVRKATPQVLRNNPNFVYIMSVDDADRYDDELILREGKGVNWTDTSAMRFKGTTIKTVSSWPDGLIIGTVATPTEQSNFWGAVNLQNDFDVIQIDKLTNAGERYFFKMLMTADTNTAFGEEVVMLDVREGNSITAAGTAITVASQNDAVLLTPESDTTYTINASKVLPGARLAVTNQAAKFKATVQEVEVPAGKTVSLYYDGKSWFKGDTKVITLSSDLAGEEDTAKVDASAKSLEE